MEVFHALHGSRSRAELLVDVSALYYLDGCTQSAIASRLRLSRQKVCRLLASAREEGVVRILVRPPQGVLVSLESELEQRFGLREVRVVALSADESPESAAQRIGATAAADFIRTLRDAHVVGLAGGELLAAMIDAVAPKSSSEVRVLQALGWEHAIFERRPLAELVCELAHRIAGTAVVLSGPSIVESGEVKRTLEADDHIGAALRALGALDTLYVEIATDGESTAEASAHLAPAGHIALRHFDHRGRMLGPLVDGHVLGISVRQLRRVGHVVALAHGPANATAISAALRTGLIHELITDERTARAIVALPSSPREEFAT
jgi:DNA-binding transcriptional regulator LsrR (DeoR family)